MPSAANGAVVKVTIADIARESGVSPSTVSLVLREKPGISAETRQRVFDTAQALGYLGQAAAPPLRQNVNSIGVIVKVRPNDLAATNSFYGPVLAGIEEVCRRQQIHLLYANLPVDEKNVPLEAPRLLTEQPTDGLLLVGMHLTSASLSLWQQQAAPLVLVDGYADGDPFDAVVTDNFAGAYQATVHLIKQGHQRIAIVGSQPQAFPSILERRAGYCQALRDHHLEPCFVDCLLWPDSAYTAALDFLSKQPQVTALFGCNDAVTIAVIQAARASGYQIPYELSVIGFDDVALAEHITPALTTMRVDKMSMGRMAAYVLLHRVAYPDAANLRTVIQPLLIERQSTVVISNSNMSRN